MMTEKQLIKNIQALKQITPRENWVSFTKLQILGGENKVSIIDILFQKKLTYAAITICTVFIISAGLVQSAMPGDLLFPLKKLAEKSQASLLSADNKSEYSLEIASERLKDLASAVKENKDANIASAIQEVKDSVGQVIKNLSNNAGNFNGVALGVKELQEEKTKVETLGVIMLKESDDLNEALAPLVENEIKILDSLSKAESLTLEQEIRLVEVKSHYKKGEYTAALEKILLITSK